MKRESPKYLFLGGIREDYCITHTNRAISGALGGNAIYSAVGARIWSDSVGILGRIGSNFDRVKLERIEQVGVDTSNVCILDQPLSTITFYAYLSPEERVDVNPALHYRRINKPMPKALLDYRSSTEGQGDRQYLSPLTIRPSDIPESLRGVQGVHLAPADYLSHVTLPPRLQCSDIRWINLDPSIRYMTPDFKHDLPALLHGINVFLPSELEAREFFSRGIKDTWEIAEAFSEMGPRFVVIKRGKRGQALWDRDSKRRWLIPAYPSKIRDVTGAGDAFCGGFLVGLNETQDPVEASLRGSVSSSLVVEGSGALYALGAAPGLAQARLSALRSGLREV
ncbi:MAG: carbohydrate kinase family protein [Anaerolineales bacterium]|nr:MAG: carbohydrate kinase family protein [Anaerolineales bacterium]